MRNISQTNLEEIATSNNVLDNFDAEITLGELMQLLEERYPGKFQDDIAFAVYDSNGDEIYYCDCGDVDGDIDQFMSDRVDEITFEDDWYGDIFEKKGYRVTLK